MNISEQLDENIEELKKRFKDCQDVIQRKMIAAGMPIYVVYVDSMIDRELVEGEFLKNIMYSLDSMRIRRRPRRWRMPFWPYSQAIRRYF